MGYAYHNRPASCGCGKPKCGGGCPKNHCDILDLTLDFSAVPGLAGVTATGYTRLHKADCDGICNLEIKALGDLTLPEDCCVDSFEFDPATGILTLTQTGDGATLTTDLSALGADIYVDNGSFNPSTLELTLGDNDPLTPNVVIDLSSLVSTFVDNGNGTFTHTSGDGTAVTYEIVDGDSANLITVGPSGGAFLDCAALVACIKANETVTTITTVVGTGNPIASYENEAGVSVTINETVTSIVNNNDGTFTFTDEAGNDTTVDMCADCPLAEVVGGGNVTVTGDGTSANPYTVSFTETLTSLALGPNNTLVYTDENGAPNVINLPSSPLTTLTLVNGALVYVDEAGNTTTLPLPTETLTNIVDNSDGTFTYTNESGTPVTIDMCDCPGATMVNNNDGTYTFTDADGNSTIIDTTSIEVEVSNASWNPATLTLTITETNGDSYPVNLGSLISSVTNNGDGTWTHTSGDGSITVINPASSVVTDNNNGTYTHTGADGTVTIIDTNSYEWSYIDGSGQTNAVPNGTVVDFCAAIAGCLAFTVQDDQGNSFPIAAGDIFNLTSNDGSVTIDGSNSGTIDLSVESCCIESETIPATAFNDPANPTDAELAAWFAANGQPNTRYILGGTAADPDFVWEADAAGTVVNTEAPVECNTIIETERTVYIKPRDVLVQFDNPALPSFSWSFVDFDAELPTLTDPCERVSGLYLNLLGGISGQSNNTDGHEMQIIYNGMTLYRRTSAVSDSFGDVVGDDVWMPWNTGDTMGFGFSYSNSTGSAHLMAVRLQGYTVTKTTQVYSCGC